MSACPSHQQLERFVTVGLSDFDRAAVDTHVKVCPLCRETINVIRRDPGTLAWSPVAKEESRHPRALELPLELREHARYEVGELIAVGGMGAVYAAEHRLLERKVVLKVIRPDLVGNPEQTLRFLREAKLAASLIHPHVVTLFEAEQIGSTLFLVMERLEGIDLARLIQERGPLPVAEACEWVRQAALGLQYVHERGMVHRDVKPSNLFLVNNQQVKILDLGLAMLRATDRGRGGLTEQGQILGTIDYLAPEQWEDSHTVDCRADVYSLGCTLYHLLAGKPPYAGDENSSLIKQMWVRATAPVPPIRDVRPDVPQPLADLLARTLAKNPDDRPSTPGELALELEPYSAIVSGTAVISSRPSSLHTLAMRTKRRPSRRLGLAVVLTTVLLLLSGLSYFALNGAWHANGHTGVTDAEGPPLPVGILHSRTGTMAISEKPVIDATLFAIEEINKNGGVMGRPIEPFIEDGASDWPTFAKKAEKLITEDKVHVVFGCWTSASRKTVKPIFEKHEHLLFYPVQYEGLEQSPNVVYVGAAPNQQIIPAIKWCCSFLHKKRLFLVGSDYVFPRAANAIIRDQAAALGAEIVGEEYLVLGSADTKPILDKIQSSKPDVILNTINGDSNVAFFRALRRAGVTPDQIPTISFSISEQELSALSTRDVQGDYAAWNYFQDVDRPKNREFVRRFRERFGEDRMISDPMEAAYVGVHLWAQAVEAAKTDDRAAVRKALRQQSYDGPGGLTTIDPTTQHVSKFIRIGRIVESNRFEVVFCSDVPLTPVPFPPTRTRAQWEEFLTDLQLRWGGQWANPGE